MKTVNTNSYVGSAIERVEDYRFLRGEGQYVGDLKREGLWHAAILRSPRGHGIVKRIDATAALAMSGVRAILTGADMEAGIPTIPFRRPNPTIGPFAQPIIAKDRVRYFGEPIAVILADSQELAEDALAFIELEIDPLPAAIDRETCMSNTVVLFENPGSNIASVFEAKKGDAEQAFAAALEISPSMWSQITSSRPIGDTLARQLERHCGKPAGWLDEDGFGHISTFGGAELGCVAAIKTLEGKLAELLRDKTDL